MLARRPARYWLGIACWPTPADIIGASGRVKVHRVPAGIAPAAQYPEYLLAGWSGVRSPAYSLPLSIEISNPYKALDPTVCLGLLNPLMHALLCCLPEQKGRAGWGAGGKEKRKKEPEESGKRGHMYGYRRPLVLGVRR